MTACNDKLAGLAIRDWAAVLTHDHDPHIRIGPADWKSGTRGSHPIVDEPVAELSAAFRGSNADVHKGFGGGKLPKQIKIVPIDAFTSHPEDAHGIEALIWAYSLRYSAKKGRYHETNGDLARPNFADKPGRLESLRRQDVERSAVEQGRQDRANACDAGRGVKQCDLILLVDVQGICPLHDHMEDVAVIVVNPFGRTSRPGRVNDTGEIVRPRRGGRRYAEVGADVLHIHDRQIWRK
jgi:hypothetical protein